MAVIANCAIPSEIGSCLPAFLCYERELTCWHNTDKTRIVNLCCLNVKQQIIVQCTQNVNMFYTKIVLR